MALRVNKDADLLIEQRTKFVTNLRTAKALGLTIPQSLLLRANGVIQEAARSATILQNRK